MKHKRRNTIILISVLLAAAVIGLLLLRLVPRGGKTVLIKKDGTAVYSCPIKEDKTVALEGNTVVIKDGFVFMEGADCGNQLCVKQGKISKTGESIVCLPNLITVEITE